MKIKKALINLLCASLVLGNITPALAAVSDSESNTYQNEVNETKETEVLYTRSASYFVTIPKRITLGSNKASSYSVKVEGDIPSDKEVYVSPIDSIAETNGFDFYMKDQNTNSPKADVTATVTQSKFYWNFQDVADGYIETNNQIVAENLSAGTWKGIFDFEINMHQVAHTHSYTETITKEPTCTEAGEKTYTCDCGDSYTEVIPAGHNYGADDKCTVCGKLNSAHIHSYIETIVKEATCTKAGEKIYTCICGDSYADIIPAIGHNYENGICIECGKEMDPYETAPENEYIDWDYTLDDENNIVTLNYYIGTEADVNVYANYIVDGKNYRTQLASNIDNATYRTPYMFNGRRQSNCMNIKSIRFSESIDTSNVTNMSYMFVGCESLTYLDVSNFDTSNVTNMRNMFDGCLSLTTLDVSNFDTSNVTDINNMFTFCKSLTSLDVSNFDTSNVTDMWGMFSNCESLISLDLSNFDTSNVTDMEHMFEYCNSLINLDISNFDTSHVTIMWNMFCNCFSLTSLDVSSFDTSNVTNMSGMFGGCSALNTIYATEGKWSTSLATSSTVEYFEEYVSGTYNMFANCGTSKVTYK